MLNQLRSCLLCSREVWVLFVMLVRWHPCKVQVKYDVYKWLCRMSSCLQVWQEHFVCGWRPRLCNTGRLQVESHWRFVSAVVVGRGLICVEIRCWPDIATQFVGWWLAACHDCICAVTDCLTLQCRPRAWLPWCLSCTLNRPEVASERTSERNSDREKEMWMGKGGLMEQTLVLCLLVLSCPLFTHSVFFPKNGSKLSGLFGFFRKWEFVGAGGMG